MSTSRHNHSTSTSANGTSRNGVLRINRNHCSMGHDEAFRDTNVHHGKRIFLLNYTNFVNGSLVQQTGGQSSYELPVQVFRLI